VEQIVAVLKQAEVGVQVAELIRQVGITEQTLYRWKKQYKGLETDQVRQFKQLQEENGRLKRLVAELTLDKVMLQDVLAKNCDALAAPPGGELFARHLPSERAACLSCGADSGLDLPLCESSGAQDGTATADSGDRADSGSIRLPEDPGAAEPRRLESGEEAGVSPV
jgi:putative transposase